MEKLKSWFKKLFKQNIEVSEEGGITCSYDGGFYSFLYAIKELVDNGDEYIMHKIGSDTFVQLYKGSFKIFDFKSFDENWKFRWHSDSIAEDFIPIELDMKSTWIVKKKLPLGQYNSYNPVGFAACGSGVLDDNIKRSWLYKINYNK